MNKIMREQDETWEPTAHSTFKYNSFSLLLSSRRLYLFTHLTLSWRDCTYDVVWWELINCDQLIQTKITFNCNLTLYLICMNPTRLKNHISRYTSYNPIALLFLFQYREVVCFRSRFKNFLVMNVKRWLHCWNLDSKNVS